MVAVAAVTVTTCVPVTPPGSLFMTSCHPGSFEETSVPRHPTVAQEKYELGRGILMQQRINFFENEL